MKFENSKQLTSQIMWELLGCIFIAAGIGSFAVQAEFPLTGFPEYPLSCTSCSASHRFFYNCDEYSRNSPVPEASGEKFLINSIRCMLLSSVMIDCIAPLFPVYTGSRLPAALCTDVLSGIGYAIIYIHNSSTTGADFIVMAVKALNPYLPLGKIILISDAVTRLRIRLWNR